MEKVQQLLLGLLNTKQNKYEFFRVRAKRAAVDYVPAEVFSETFSSQCNKSFRANVALTDSIIEAEMNILNRSSTSQLYQHVLEVFVSTLPVARHFFLVAANNAAASEVGLPGVRFLTGQSGFFGDLSGQKYDAKPDN